MEKYNQYFSEDLLIERAIKYGPFSAEAIVDNQKIIPKAPGIYFWWLENKYAKQHEISGHQANGFTLVYVGTAKDLRTRLAKQEMADMKGVVLKMRKKATQADWIVDRSVSTWTGQFHSMASPARNVRAFLNTHWLDYAATQEFFNNLYITFQVIDIKADPKDKKAWNAEYQRRVVNSHEDKLVAKFAPQFNIKQIVDVAIRAERKTAGKISKEKTLKYIQDLFGTTIDFSLPYKDLRAQMQKAMSQNNPFD